MLMFVGNELNDKAPGGRPMRWCFVLLSVALGTQFLSSYPSTSALSTCGVHGNPLDLVPDLPTCPGAATSSDFPFAHMHVHVTDDERFDDMGVHIGAVRHEVDLSYCGLFHLVRSRKRLSPLRRYRPDSGRG